MRSDLKSSSVLKITLLKIMLFHNGYAASLHNVYVLLDTMCML